MALKHCEPAKTHRPSFVGRGRDRSGSGTRRQLEGWRVPQPSGHGEFECDGQSGTCSTRPFLRQLTLIGHALALKVDAGSAQSCPSGAVSFMSGIAPELFVVSVSRQGVPLGAIPHDDRAANLGD